MVIKRGITIFRNAPIDKLSEMKTIASVQKLTERVIEHPATKHYDSYRNWLVSYQNEHALCRVDVINTETLEKLFDDSASYLQTLEDSIWERVPKIGANLKEDDEEEYVEVLKLKYAKLKCQHFKVINGANKKVHGETPMKNVLEILDVIVHGKNQDWLKLQFQSFDSDADGNVTESETKMILESVLDVQKSVLNEIFQYKVENMPKKHMKLLQRSYDEENWKSKIPEKIRCVWHFAEKNEGDKSISWGLFAEAQELEMPELFKVMNVYSRGFYDDRFLFHERKREKRSTIYHGMMMAIALGISDYVFDII